MERGIKKRLDMLQQIADRDRGCMVTVRFTDGTEVVVPYYDGITGRYDEETGEFVESEIERRGWAGEVVSMEADDWRYANMIALMEALFKPVGGGANGQH